MTVTPPSDAVDADSEPTPIPAAAQPAAGTRYVGIAVIPRRRRAIEKALGRVVECGGEALLITADGSSIPMYEGVQHIDLLHEESRVGLNRVLAISPKRVAGRLVGKRVGGRSLAWKLWLKSRPYKVGRFYLLARLMERKTDWLRPTEVTNVLLAGVESWPIAWHIAQANPDVEIGWGAPPAWGLVEGEPLYDPRTEWEKARDARWDELMKLTGKNMEKAVILLEAQNIAIAEGLPIRDPAEHLAEIEAMSAAEMHEAALHATEEMAGDIGDTSVNAIADELASEVGDDVLSVDQPEAPPVDSPLEEILTDEGVGPDDPADPQHS